MIFGIGTDIFLMSRIAKQAISDGDPFIMRSYTEKERKESKNHNNLEIYYATRFSAKEAVYKSISKIGLEFRPEENDIYSELDGCPRVFLYGKTEQALSQKTSKKYAVFISISYDTEYCSTFAVAEIF